MPAEGVQEMGDHGVHSELRTASIRRARAALTSPPGRKKGSSRLGAELRRLRGRRSLKAICDLTKSLPLAGLVSPIGIATLSEIESGKAIPQIATLQALALIYKTPLSLLVAQLAEERLLEEAGGLDELSEESLYERYVDLSRRGEWARALAVACLAERTIKSASVLSWRANRASALGMLGMREECVILLAQCCEDPSFPPLPRYILIYNLAVAHFHAGNPWHAEVVLEQADALVEAAKPPADAITDVTILRAELLICRHFDGSPVPEAALRECIRRLDKASEISPSEDHVRQLRLRFQRALLYCALGNRLVARRDAEVVLKTCEHVGNLRLVAESHLACALIAIDCNDRESAKRHYDAAIVAGEKSGRTWDVFQASFLLYKLLRDERPGRATKLLRRCDEIAGLVTTRAHTWKEYLSELRSRAGVC